MQGEDEGLLLAIEQTVDALTFSQTHVVDSDFRAHSRTTIDSVLSLQDEQRARVDNAFKAIAPSPQYLANQLLSIYRGESASIAIARENVDPTLAADVAGIIDDMTDTQCKAFKKEMKQRIHEWEGSFRDAYQREAAPQDKVLLRPIYELYKHAKNRVLKADAAGTSAASLGGRQSTTLSAPALSTPSRVSMSSSGAQMQNATTVQPTPERTHSSGAMFNVSPLVSSRQTAPQQHVPQQHVNVGVSTPGGGGYSAAAPLTTKPSPNTVSQGGYSSASQPPGTQAYVATNAAAPVSVSPGLTPSTDLPVEELLQEKRRIKRLLHQFEAAFEQRHGRKPTRDDRREYNREYHRYGELKALLNEHARDD